jgi:hypothetical protein
MHCYKVMAWFGLQYDCPHSSDESVCNSTWVTLVGGASVQVCASCYLFIHFNNLKERGKEDVMPDNG